ncbi:hypothetical protein AB1E18_006599 [Capra hircus]
MLSSVHFQIPCEDTSVRKRNIWCSASASGQKRCLLHSTSSFMTAFPSSRMRDFVMTATYHRAILQNHTDFRNKVVLDVGCGSGILSFFAVQAGALRVYAVEAGSVAQYAEMLVESNNLSDKITVLPGKIEEISLPEPVDVIISEPMGYMLFNERMLESYLHSKKWLKTNE